MSTQSFSIESAQGKTRVIKVQILSKNDGVDVSHHNRKQTFIKSESSDTKYIKVNSKPKVYVVSEDAPVLLNKTPDDNVINDENVQYDVPVSVDDMSVGLYQETAEGFGMATACVICGDRGTGFHYSVYSCEGCKGFFKRSVQKNLNYACRENSACLVTKSTRNSCQYCRFQKCLQAGMKTESVREDRTPGGKHRHKKQYAHGISIRTQVEKYRKIEDDPMLKTIMNIGVNNVPELSMESSVDKLEDIPLKELMAISDQELKLIIEWAKQVPGFRELENEDQISLVKSNFVDLFIFRMAFRSLENDNTVILAQNLFIEKQAISSLSWGREIMTCAIEFVDRLTSNLLLIDYTEFSILCAILLLSPDAEGINDRLVVSNAQSRYLDLLQQYNNCNRSQDILRCTKLLFKISTLRSQAAKAAVQFLSSSVEHGARSVNTTLLEQLMV